MIRDRSVPREKKKPQISDICQKDLLVLEKNQIVILNRYFSRVSESPRLTLDGTISEPHDLTSVTVVTVPSVDTQTTKNSVWSHKSFNNGYENLLWGSFKRYKERVVMSLSSKGVSLVSEVIIPTTDNHSPPEVTVVHPPSLSGLYRPTIPPRQQPFP